MLRTIIVAACFVTTRGFAPQHVRLDVAANTVAQSSSMPFIDIVRMNSNETTITSSSVGQQQLPPVIRSIADERREFQMNLGKAMDTIRKDMPEILRRKPDYSIYHKDITVVDPSGVTIQGLDNYKSSIKFLQTFLKFWFKERSGLQFRMVYDFCRSSIKVSWNAVLIPKVPLGRPVYVDGISVYKLDVESGKIMEHKFENLIINNTPVVPPYGMFSMMQQDLMGLTPQGVVSPGIPAGI
uniref:Uncharacterized protein n=1 Tax=Craspedostauros australis TaxID=1486917 RepID=A0A7R9WVZ4_9STRA|mmetsp:Transcript_22311/g.62244  ORF Transcript_22311/g.62244 Transcript_22311/m.62244 type:complete len:240 (+) Transcript_22311:303-1022(+)